MFPSLRSEGHSCSTCGEKKCAGPTLV